MCGHPASAASIRAEGYADATEHPSLPWYALHYLPELKYNQNQLADSVSASASSSVSF